MTRISSFLWLPVAAFLIVVTVVSSAVSTYRYLHLVEDTDLMRLTPKDDATWGIMQLNVELLKFGDALHDATIGNTLEGRENLRLRLDILYSRFEVIDQVFTRYRDFLLAMNSESDDNNYLEEQDKIEKDFKSIRNLFADIDRDVQGILETSDTKGLVDIRKRLDPIIPAAAQFAAEVNQFSSQRNFMLRENVLRSMGEYQVALLTIIIVIVIFSGASLGLYFNARRAERVTQKTAQELKVSNMAKTNFLSSMSHELRTPLNAIIGFTQLMGIKLGENRNDETKEYEQYILRSAEHLLGLINQVLDLEKIETGNMKLDVGEVNLEGIIKQSIEMISPIANKSNISITMDGMHDIVLHTDAFQFRQVILNFLSNAVKYNATGGHVSVECVVAKNKSVTVSVIDNGMGIPSDKRHLIFEPFNRLGREAGRIEGSGIGLNICQSLARLLNGSVGYKPNPDGGSIFWISLLNQSVEKKKSVA